MPQKQHSGGKLRWMATVLFISVFFSFIEQNNTALASSMTLYTYTGNELITNPGVTNGVTQSALSYITFTVIGSLGVNRPYSRFFPIAWSVSDGVHNFSSSSPPPNLTLFFEFATNSLGEITEWYAQFPTHNGIDFTLLRTSNALAVGPPGTFDEVVFCSAISCDFSRDGDYRTWTVDHPGVWTMQATAETQPIPEPSTWFLFVTGFVGLLGYHWRRTHAGNGTRSRMFRALVLGVLLVCLHEAPAAWCPRKTAVYPLL